MAKERVNVRRRMQEAAVELFLERGFDGTTATEIAARAGFTERTFFRHFPDKRDVLFDEDDLRTRLDAAIKAAPAKIGPLGIVEWAFQSLVPMFEANRPISEPAQTVIARTPSLQERRLSKTSSLISMIADALRHRRVESMFADISAAVGVAVAAHALHMWFEDPKLRLADCFQKAFRALAQVAHQMPKGIAT